MEQRPLSLVKRRALQGLPDLAKPGGEGKGRPRCAPSWCRFAGRLDSHGIQPTQKLYKSNLQKSEFWLHEYYIHFVDEDKQKTSK